MSIKRNEPLNSKYILEQARGRWREILTACGINEKYLKNKHGPCPICGGKDRFRFDDKSLGAYICNQCGAGYGIKLLESYHKCQFTSAIKMVAHSLSLLPDKSIYSIFDDSYLHPTTYANDSGVVLDVIDEKQKNKITKTWYDSKIITNNDAVDEYLQSRGIVLKSFPKVLRLHQRLPYYEGLNLIGNYHAMLGLVQDYKGEGVTLHRTYLENGRKANVNHPKKLMTAIRQGATNGSAIRLFSPVNGILAIAEGIETALSVYAATGIPSWAAINAFCLENVKLPNSVQEVVIAVDNDETGTGQLSAYKLARRLVCDGLRVKRIMPKKLGSDFNDLLMEEGI
jgi:putative DNA primase/helicase